MVCCLGFGGGLCVVLSSRHRRDASPTPSTRLSQRDAGRARWRAAARRTLRHLHGRPGPGLLHVRGDALDLRLRRRCWTSRHRRARHRATRRRVQGRAPPATPSPRRSKKDAGLFARARRERALPNRSCAYSMGALGMPTVLSNRVSGRGRRGEVDARWLDGRAACARALGVASRSYCFGGRLVFFFGVGAPCFVHTGCRVWSAGFAASSSSGSGLSGELGGRSWDAVRRLVGGVSRGGRSGCPGPTSSHVAPSERAAANKNRPRAARRMTPSTAVFWGAGAGWSFRRAEALGLQPRRECGVVGSRSDARAAFLRF